MEEKRSHVISEYPQPEIDPIQKTTEQKSSRTPGETHESAPKPSATRVSKKPGQQKKNGIQMSKRTMIVAGMLAALCLLGAFGGMAAYRHFAIPHVTGMHVGARQNVDQYIGGGGIVHARQEFDLAFPFAGRVQQVLVKVGDRVKPNQPLLKLDQAQLTAQLKLAQDTVSAAESYLYSVSNAFPYNPVAVAAAQQDLQEARSEYEMLKSQADSGKMVSSVAGVVTVINVENGEAFGGNKPLMTVIDPSQIIVRAKVPLSNLKHIRTGMNARVSPAAMPDREINGKVISVVPQADPQTDTFEVWIEVANKEQVLLPGMSAFVSIQGQVNAFVIPRLAVLNPDYESSVFLIRGEEVQMKRVRVIGRNDSSVFVDQGLAPNDKIVLLPLNKLRDGQRITVTEMRRVEGGQK